MVWSIQWYSKFMVWPIKPQLKHRAKRCDSGKDTQLSLTWIKHELELNIGHNDMLFWIANVCSTNSWENTDSKLSNDHLCIIKWNKEKSKDQFKIIGINSSAF